MIDATSGETTDRPGLPQATIEDVLRAAEELRAEQYADVPAQLLEDILSAERMHLGDQPAATRAVTRAVEGYLSRNGA